jgi:hypothetical protein
MAGTGHIHCGLPLDGRHSGVFAAKEVKWANGAGGYRISIQAPDRTRGTVVLPRGASRCPVTVNGRLSDVTRGQRCRRSGRRAYDRCDGGRRS